jgi:hypothetical protein
MNDRRKLVSLAVLAVLAAGCVTTSGAAHLRAGELFVPGEKSYDDYFAAVHVEQTKETHWATDRKTAHEPIVAACNLGGDSTDAAIGQAVHAKPGAAQALATPIEQTVHAELERIRALNAAAAKAEELLKQGHGLEGHVSENFGKAGSGLGPSPEDVKKALEASYEILGTLREHAKKEAKAAEELADNLRSEGTAGHAEHPREPARQASSSTSSSGKAGAAPQQPAQPPSSPQQAPPQPAHPAEVFQP